MGIQSRYIDNLEMSYTKVIAEQQSRTHYFDALGRNLLKGLSFGAVASLLHVLIETIFEEDAPQFFDHLIETHSIIEFSMYSLVATILATHFNLKRIELEQLFLEKEKVHHKLNAINTITHTLSLATDESLLDVFLEKLSHFVPSDVSLFGYLDETNTLVIATTKGEVFKDMTLQQKAGSINLSAPNRVWVKVIEARTTLMLNNINLSVPEGHHPIHNLLVIPVFHGAVPLGIVMLANDITRFTSQDQDLATTLVDESSPIIHARQARLQEEIQRKANELRLAAKTEELQIALNAAIQAEKKMSAFFGTMNHVLRTPVHLILGFAQELHHGRDSLSPEEYSEYIDTMIDQAGQLMKMINKFLEMAKLSRNEVLPEFRSLPIRDIIARISQKANREIETQKLALDFKVTVSVSVPDSIISDNERVMQILESLISNALKFTPGGSVELDVDCSEKELVFFIKDTGIGISADQLKSIFEHHIEVNFMTTRFQGGTGISLLISKKLAHLLGGELTAFSKPQEGRTFRLSLPVDSLNK